MPFDPALYSNRNHNIAKVIIDKFQYQWFRGKRILDLGCGLGHIGAAFTRLGATVVACDAREKNLEAVRKLFPHIQTIKADLDKEFPFSPYEFDIVLSIGLLCHLKEHEKHLQDICGVAEHIILETEVLDNPNKDAKLILYEEKAIDDLSFNGEGSILSTAYIQHLLAVGGTTFSIVGETKLNHGAYRYDWLERAAGRKYGQRRIWFAQKNKFVALQAQHRGTQAQIQREIAPLPPDPILVMPVPRIEEATSVIPIITSAEEIASISAPANPLATSKMRILYLSLGAKWAEWDKLRRTGASLFVFDFWTMWEQNNRNTNKIIEEYFNIVKTFKPQFIHMQAATEVLNMTTILEAKKIIPEVIIIKDASE